MRGGVVRQRPRRFAAVREETDRGTAAIAAAAANGSLVERGTAPLIDGQRTATSPTSGGREIGA
jgi:hypothetical protein